MTDEYRVDDLARKAGVSVRNVRVYQDRGLLPPPRRQGRTGWYSEAHLTRLRLITRMLDRGYTFATISELLTAAQYGLRVEDVLTTDRDGPSAPARRRKTVLTRSELDGALGGDVADEDIDRGVELGVTARVGADYTVENPVFFEAAKVLSAAGISLADTLDQTEGVRRDLDDIADRFTALVTDSFLPAGGDPFELGPDALAAVAELITTLKPLALHAVNAMFVEAMDRRITATMENIVGPFGSDSSQPDQAD